jgi:RNA-directed DNA polymerase
LGNPAEVSGILGEPGSGKTISLRFIPGSYHHFYIRELKRRFILEAHFRGSVVYHALSNVIEPIFEQSFIYDSYANRVG